MSRRKKGNGVCCDTGQCGGFMLPPVVDVKSDKSLAGHVYYNITISNPNVSGNIPAEFTYFQDEAILENPSEYHLSVIRFSVPGSLIPIFIYPNNLPTLATPNNTVYSVTLSYAGNDYQTFLIFVPANLAVPITDQLYYGIFSYQHFINMVNTALQTSFTALKTANPAAPPTQAPFFIYNSETQLISLICQKEYSLVGSVQIFYNYRTHILLDTIDVNFFGTNTANGKDAQIIINNFKNNCFSTCPINVLINTTNAMNTITSAGLFTVDMDKNTVSASGIPLNTIASFVDINTMTLSQNATATATVNALFTNNNLLQIRQEFEGLFNWNALKSIVITSGTLPTRSEFITQSNSNNLNVSSNTLRILTDFEPLITTGPDLFNTIQYFPPGEYRLLDLLDKVPLKKLDGRFQWQDKQQNLYPINIPPAQCATLKILFRLKNIIGGEKSY